MNLLEELNLTPLSWGLAAAAVLLLVVIFSLSRKISDLKHRQAVTETTLSQLQAQNTQDREQLSIRENELTSAREDNVSLREQMAALSSDNDRLQAESNSLSHELSNATERVTDLSTELARTAKDLENVKALREIDKASFETRERELRESFTQAQEEQQRRFRTEQELLETKLTSLGETMLKRRTEELEKKSSEHFEKSVTPLKEELKGFRELIDRTRKDSSEQSGRLESELKHMQEAQQNLTKQADDLTKALRSGGKAQGMWGELQLERVLDAAGLTKGIEYEREVAGDRAMGETGRPDAVIRLPEDHNLIIDAKCSLTAFAEYYSADSDEERERAAADHLASVKSHIDGLAKRAYQDYRSLNSPSFVFMFVPLDGALNLAFQTDHGIYNYAEQKNIYLVSPTTLIPSLKVVSNLWVLARQNEHMRELAGEAQKIAAKLDGVREAYDDVIKKKDSFEGSLELFGNRLLNGRSNLSTMLMKFSTKAPAVLAELDGQTVDVAPEESASNEIEFHEE